MRQAAVTPMGTPTAMKTSAMTANQLKNGRVKKIFTILMDFCDGMRCILVKDREQIPSVVSLLLILFRNYLLFIVIPFKIKLVPLCS